MVSGSAHGQEGQQAPLYLRRFQISLGKGREVYLQLNGQVVLKLYYPQEEVKISVEQSAVERVRIRQLGFLSRRLALRWGSD